MCKQICAAVLWKNKAKTLGIVKPLNLAVAHHSHSVLLIIYCYFLSLNVTWRHIPLNQSKIQQCFSIEFSLFYHPSYDADLDLR